MAEERNLGAARALEKGGEEDATKADLQHRMEETRENISQTVAEIKGAVSDQYQSVKESVHDALDWRAQFGRRPVAFSVGALALGFIAGYGLAAVMKGGGGGLRRGNRADEEEASQEPGLMEKFKGTWAYKRLESGASALGDRLIDKLSEVGKNVMLPAVTGKIAETVGGDQSDRRRGQGGTRAQQEQQTRPPQATHPRGRSGRGDDERGSRGR